MKKTFLLISVLTYSLTLFSQGIKDAEKMMYYERYATAENILHQVIHDEPKDEEAWYLLGEAYLGQKKQNALKDTLMKADAAVSTDPLIKVLNGAILLKENKYAEATKMIQEALEETKFKDPRVLEATARAYMSVKNTDKNYPVQILERAIARDKKNPDLYILLGDAYRNKGDGTNAYTSYMKALDKDAGNAAALYKIGNIYLSQKNPGLYLQYYMQALAADSLYAPAYYSLYYHYYTLDVNTAMNYLQKYIAHSDYNIENEYAIADQLYVSRRYDEAISKAKELVQQEGDHAQPRIFKLIAYSYAAKNDFSDAAPFMKKYFSTEADSNYVPKDYVLEADILAHSDSAKDEAIPYYEKAFLLEKDSAEKLVYAKQLINLSKELKNYVQQEKWAEYYYSHNPKATNLDLFNWGVVNYQIKNYSKADSVFHIFTEKYPDERFGYYWRAKSNAAIDSAMAQGLAIPYYRKVIEIAKEDTTNATNVLRLKESYGYIATYMANIEKDYTASIDYFEKLLALDPGNLEIKRNIDILKNKTSGNN